MEIIVLLVILCIGWFIYQAAYKSGKREGSRKGYGVGFSRGKRSQEKGCLFMLMILLVTVPPTVHVLASILSWK